MKRTRRRCKILSGSFVMGTSITVRLSLLDIIKTVDVTQGEAGGIRTALARLL